MSHALGCDLVALSDIAESVEAFGERFLTRVFTAGELAAAGGDTARLAARFAAKEAVIKALAVTDEATVPTEIEVVGAGVAPTLRLHGEMAHRARSQRWGEIVVTLSHTDCHAMAVVLAEID
ncbi:MAG: holo-ACP synthase [Corynebacteriales bacterium]|nr:holo-ACP synthase [Mycobacteriales bacterium]